MDARRIFYWVCGFICIGGLFYGATRSVFHAIVTTRALDPDTPVVASDLLWLGVYAVWVTASLIWFLRPQIEGK